MQKNTPVTPWAYIPTLYFLEGMPYIIINAVSPVLYANLGYSNTQIAFWTGWLYLPWILKMFWSPLLDARSTKRRWLLGTQSALAAVFLLLAALNTWNAFCHAQALNNLTFFSLSLFGLLAGAFVSATQDIAIDGYYLLALTPARQSYFVGIRTIFYRLSMIFGSGILVAATGALGKAGLGAHNWSCLFLFLVLLFAAGALWHRFILPCPRQDVAAQTPVQNAWGDAFKTYFSQANIVYILLFILLYRLGDALLEKIVPLFLIKPQSEGALGLSLHAYGIIKGTLGLGAVIAGNLAGGWMLGRYGFKKCIWPFAVILILPNFFYAYMAWVKPGVSTTAVLITLEHFGNGLALMAFNVFIMYVSTGKYKTSHYAISTGIMALGMMVPSVLSGWMQTRFGYEVFFLAASLLSLITLAVVPLTGKIKTLEETEKHFRSRSIGLQDAD